MQEDDRRRLDRFVAEVVDRFGLGNPHAFTATGMRGSTNRLWRLDTTRGAFVVKEFSHDSRDGIARRRNAAAFEMAVYATSSVVMAEPMLSSDGEVVEMLMGSRDHLVPVRVHRWLEGEEVTDPPDRLVRTAGQTLGAIQQAGRRWSTRASGSLDWWDQDPLLVAERLERADFGRLAARAKDLLRDGLAIVAAAEQRGGEWVYTHNDHKPENSRLVEGSPAVLDWDECGHCAPRLEAVESALRWSGTPPRAASLRAFLDGYNEAGGSIDGLTHADFAKWIAALLGWFAFQARRALGDWPTERADERAGALSNASDTLSTLATTLRQLDVWVGWA